MLTEHRHDDAADTVLVVEDDPAICDLIRDVLEGAGYQVVTAVDGAALPLARERQPAVALVDLMMPQMDGFEVSRHLRTDPATATIPIVVMSAQLDATARVAASLGDDCLPKPFDLQQLVDTVARWTRKRRATAGGHKEIDRIGAR